VKNKKGLQSHQRYCKPFGVNILESTLCNPTPPARNAHKREMMMQMMESEQSHDFSFFKCRKDRKFF
jgi:hypothetical protein